MLNFKSLKSILLFGDRKQIHHSQQQQQRERFFFSGLLILTPINFDSEVVFNLKNDLLN